MVINRCKLSIVSLFMMTCALVLLTSSIFISAKERRTALVIGNGAYKSSPLGNPVNDANDMAAALKNCNFRVMKSINASRREMRKAIRKFGEEINKGAVGLFYYAGHGIQVDGENYLVPVNAAVYTEAEVEDECLKVSSVLRQMESAGNRLNIIILDACRDNPFGRSFRSSNAGLAKMDAPTGSILAYATAPGSVAADGTGRNGLYTSMLLRHIMTPNLAIERVFKRVRINVVNASDKRQTPWESSSLMGDFYFNTKRGIAVKKRPTVEPDKPAQEAPKIAMGKKPSVAPKRSVTNSLGMEFVYISPGTFMMGSPSNEPGRDNDEKQHRVTLTQGFYMQTTEVTQGQWKTVMGSNLNRAESFKNCGNDCPVENVDWNDTQQFIRKLNQREGSGTYRLPTEAEWEYAARAGSTTAFANGDISGTGKKCSYDSNLDAMGWYCDNSNKKTHPIAQKSPNAWGLYDMHGNVWEWCQDWYGGYPSSSVTDPTGPSSGFKRVRRGGSYAWIAGYCRSACRDDFPPSFNNPELGFRLAITIDSADKKVSSDLSAKEIDSDGRFIAYSNGVIYDKNTSLEWYAGSDKSTNWNEAKTWIENLNVPGGGWRMPTRREIKTLYKRGAGTRNMTPLLKTSGWWVWSGEIQDSSSAWAFAFIGAGREILSTRNSSNDRRGFAVRSRK
jgi:formylglycine-generating enzyme required for sulfatase activity